MPLSIRLNSGVLWNCNSLVRGTRLPYHRKVRPIRLGLVSALALFQPMYGADLKLEDFFETQVRPVLAKNCFPCHTQARMGGLAMTSRTSLLQGGNSGPAIKPGNPDQSLLILAVRREHERIKMPPAGPLEPHAIEILTEWVKSGAVWPEAARPAVKTAGSSYTITPEQRAFWAFQPVHEPDLPALHRTTRTLSPIDALVDTKLHALHLKPAPPADKRTWIRRATLDLTGLPPTPEEVDAFIQDRGTNAKAAVIDRLLASPRYGERWGRYWLDIARYSDDHLPPDGEKPYPNAFRYRDWVIQAFNDDMPYDLFIKAQIAGDLLPDKQKLIGGLGLYGLSPDFQDDRVDVTARAFLGLTVACAQCHDHKFDPIPTKDFYALQGVFNSTQLHDYALVSDKDVEEFNGRKKRYDDENTHLQDFLKAQADQLAGIFAARTADYLRAAYRVAGPEKADAHAAAAASGLDEEVLARWLKYIAKPQNHPYLDAFDSLLKRKASDSELDRCTRDFEKRVTALPNQKKTVDEKNLITLGGLKTIAAQDPLAAKMVTLSRDDYVLWRDLFFAPTGLLYFADGKIDRFLTGVWKQHLDDLRAHVAELKKAVPEQYPFLHGIADVEKPADIHVLLRGNRDTPGEIAPRAFLSILSSGTPQHFTHGSGRLELAEAIADPRNPLTARVMVNRIWLGHFGQAIVRTPGNFGMLGDRPSNPELLDYLAAEFVRQKWSMKALHREIMLSSTYGLNSREDPASQAADGDGRFFWRFEPRRLDAEALRDQILFVSGQLDLTSGGPPAVWNDANHRRTVFCYFSRRQLDPMLTLFDVPNPNNTSDQRLSTDVPVQRLFLLNSALIMKASEVLAQRIHYSGTTDQQIDHAYRLLFQRRASKSELALGRSFLSKPDSWPEYLQVLMSSNEFMELE